MSVPRVILKMEMIDSKPVKFPFFGMLRLGILWMNLDLPTLTLSRQCCCSVSCSLVSSGNNEKNNKQYSLLQQQKTLDNAHILVI